MCDFQQVKKIALSGKILAENNRTPMVRNHATGRPSD